MTLCHLHSHRWHDVISHLQSSHCGFFSTKVIYSRFYVSIFQCRKRDSEGTKDSMNEVKISPQTSCSISLGVGIKTLYDLLV